MLFPYFLCIPTGLLTTSSFVLYHTAILSVRNWDILRSSSFHRLQPSSSRCIMCWMWQSHARCMCIFGSQSVFLKVSVNTGESGLTDLAKCPSPSQNIHFWQPLCLQMEFKPSIWPTGWLPTTFDPCTRLSARSHMWSPLAGSECTFYGTV